MASKAAQRALKEYGEVTGEHPIEGVKIHSEDPANIWNVIMAGPPGTPFEEGVFHLICKFDNYPFKPPKVIFQTKIYHPNVAEDGTICEQIYETSWKPTKKVREVFDIVKSLLISPVIESALRQDIAKQFIEDPKGYAAQATQYTKQFAK